MTMDGRRRRTGGVRALRSVAAGAVLAIGSAMGLAGCHGLMDVTDPTLIQDKDIANAAGANAKRVYSLMQVSFNESYIVQDVAALTDERMLDEPSIVNNPPYADFSLDMDRRDTTLMLEFQKANGVDPHLATLSTMFTQTTPAIVAMRNAGADSVKHEYLAQLFSIRAYLLLQMAEDMCSGFPINDVTDNNEAAQSGPISTDSATRYALQAADSALANGHDTTRFLNFARVVKGRALLDLGRYDEAAAAVAAVPTEFTYTTDPSTLGNSIYQGCCFAFAVGQREGGNGLPFVSAQDPRVPTFFAQTRANDATDSLYDQGIYTSTSTPIVLVSGIEARLIEAEAALHASDPGQAFSILSTLRGTVGLGAMSAPATADAQVDSLYKERAFWLYLTGRRLGDMRRLITRYGRGAETVFPTGRYPLGGGNYGPATSFLFTVEAQHYNSKITTGCAAS